MLFIIYNHLFRICIVLKKFRKLTWQMLDVAVEVLNQHWMNWTNWTMNSWICLWFFWLRFWLTKSLSLHHRRSLLRRNPRHRPCGLLFSFWCFFDVTLLSEYSFLTNPNSSWKIIDFDLTLDFWSEGIYFFSLNNIYNTCIKRTGKWVLRLHVNLKVIRLHVKLKSIRLQVKPKIIVFKRDKHLHLNWTKKISTIFRMRTK